MKFKPLIHVASLVLSGLMLASCGPTPSTPPQPAVTESSTPLVVSQSTRKAEDVTALLAKLKDAPESQYTSKVITDEQGRLVLVFFGSMSCPPIPSTALLDQSGKLTVRLKAQQTFKACTADLGPVVWDAKIPEKSVVKSAELFGEGGQPTKVKVYNLEDPSAVVTPLENPFKKETKK